MDKKGLLRQLPKIDELLNEDLILKELNNTEIIIVVDSLRESIDLYRKGILQDEIHSYEKEEILNYAIKY